MDKLFGPTNEAKHLHQMFDKLSIETIYNTLKECNNDQFVAVDRLILINNQRELLEKKNREEREKKLIKEQDELMKQSQQEQLKQEQLRQEQLKQAQIKQEQLLQRQEHLKQEHLKLEQLKHEQLKQEQLKQQPEKDYSVNQPLMNFLDSLQHEKQQERVESLKQKEKERDNLGSHNGSQFTQIPYPHIPQHPYGQPHFLPSPHSHYPSQMLLGMPQQQYPVPIHPLHRNVPMPQYPIQQMHKAKMDNDPSFREILLEQQLHQQAHQIKELKESIALSEKQNLVAEEELNAKKKITDMIKVLVTSVLDDIEERIDDSDTLGMNYEEFRLAVKKEIVFHLVKDCALTSSSFEFQIGSGITRKK